MVAVFSRRRHHVIQFGGGRFRGGDRRQFGRRVARRHGLGDLTGGRPGTQGGGAGGPPDDTGGADQPRQGRAVHTGRRDADPERGLHGGLIDRAAEAGPRGGRCAHREQFVGGQVVEVTRLQRLGDGDRGAAQRQPPGRFPDLAGLRPGLGHQLLLVGDHPVRSTGAGHPVGRIAVGVVEPVPAGGDDRGAPGVPAAPQRWAEVAVGGRLRPRRRCVSRTPKPARAVAVSGAGPSGRNAPPTETTAEPVGTGSSPGQGLLMSTRR